MDSRQTLHANETFLTLLNAAFGAGEKVYLLIDDEGLFRTEGFVTTLRTEVAEPSVVLDNSTVVAIHKIVAVNGVFRPEYGEC